MFPFEIAMFCIQGKNVIKRLKKWCVLKMSNLPHDLTSVLPEGGAAANAHSTVKV